MLLCCPLFNWEGVALPFFEIIFRGVAPIIVNYGHIHVHRGQSAVPGALTARKTISKNNKKRGERGNRVYCIHFVSVGTLRWLFGISLDGRMTVRDAQVGRGAFWFFCARVIAIFDAFGGLLTLQSILAFVLG